MVRMMVMVMMVMSDEGGRKGGCGNGISGAGMNPTRECECGCREYRHGDTYGGDHVPVCDIYIVEMDDDDMGDPLLLSFSVGRRLWSHARVYVRGVVEEKR